MNVEQIFLLALFCGSAWLACWLMLKPMFWILALGIGGLAAAFATLASIIHFQIGGALLFFFLMAACWAGALMIFAGKQQKDEIERERRYRRSRRRGLLPYPMDPDAPSLTPTEPEQRVSPTDPATLDDVRRQFRHER